MPPQKILKIMYQEIEFGGIFGGFSCQYILIHALTVVLG